MSDVLQIKDEGPVRTISLHRPEKKNALSGELAWGIVTAVAGMSLAMSTDIRLGAASLRFIAGYPRIGGSPDGGLTWSLPQAIGYEQAMRFLLENRTVDADEARRLGFVGEVVDDDRLEPRLAEYCALLAE